MEPVHNAIPQPASDAHLRLFHVFDSHHVDSPEAFLAALRVLMMSPTACVRQFLYCLSKDLIADYGYPHFLDAPEGQTVLSPLPGMRTQHVHDISHFLLSDSTTGNTPVAALFGAGRYTYYDASGVSQTHVGPGLGVALESASAHAFRGAQEAILSSGSPIFVHWPHLLASANRGYYLYPPAAYLALLALPVVRTYSIVLFEVLFHQIALAIFDDLCQRLSRTDVSITALFPRYDGDPQMVQSVDSILQYFCILRRDRVYNVPALWEGIDSYVKSALFGAHAKHYTHPQPVLRALLRGPDTTALMPGAFVQTQTPWAPYQNLTVEDAMTLEKSAYSSPRLVPMDTQSPTVKAAQALPPKSAKPLGNVLWDRSYYWDLHTTSGGVAYVSQFMTELAYLDNRNRTSRYRNFVSLFNQSSLYVAVNWENARSFLEYFHLAPFPPALREELMSSAFVSASVCASLTSALSPPVGDTVPRALPDNLSHLSTAEGRGHCVYTTFPANQYRRYLQRARYTPARRNIPATKIRIRKSSAAQQLDDGKPIFILTTMTVMSGITHKDELVTVLMVNNRQSMSQHSRHRTLFHVSCADFTTDNSDYYTQKNVLRKRHYSEEFDLKLYSHLTGGEARIFSTVDSIGAAYLPHSKHSVFRAIYPQLKIYSSYTREMFLRWSLLGSPNAALPRGKAALPLLEKAAKIPASTLMQKNRFHYVDGLITKYLRPGMSDEEYARLCELCAPFVPVNTIARRASAIRDNLMKASCKDLTAYPMRRVDLRFCRDFYQSTGISIRKEKVLPLPEGYTSILLLSDG